MESTAAPRPGSRPAEIGLIATLLIAALAAWIGVAEIMEGMDAGPGTEPGELGWYVGAWVLMMAAMMLPSVAPMVTLFTRVNSSRKERFGATPVPTAAFVAGYLLVWASVGLVAFGIYELAAAIDPSFLRWEEGGRYAAAGAVAAAGVYELSPLKAVCLRHCRGPMHFLLGGWRDGVRGAVEMGVIHGGFCAGCCVGLMLVLWAVGVMSIAWMIAIAGVIAFQKLSPLGERVRPITSVALIALGLWIAAAPGSVPFLTEPGSPAAMDAMERMQPDPAMDSMDRKRPDPAMDSMGR